MIIFYEKSGCITNGKQKALLTQAGYDFESRDLREQDWQADILKTFFEGLPVSQWFNKAAPDVKSGAVDPASLDEQSALDLMVENPLLIRRPLIETEQGKGCGFEKPMLERLGLGELDEKAGREGCSSASAHSCPDPQEV